MKSKRIEDLKEEIQISQNIPFSEVLISDKIILKLLLIERAKSESVNSMHTISILREIEKLNDDIYHGNSHKIDFGTVNIFGNDKPQPEKTFSFEVNYSLLKNELDKLNDIIKNVIVKHIIDESPILCYIKKNSDADEEEIARYKDYIKKLKYDYQVVNNIPDELDYKEILKGQIKYNLELVRYYNSDDYIEKYLEDIFNSMRPDKSGKNLGGVCYLLHEKNIFKTNKYADIIRLLGNYWGLELPKEIRPNKYKAVARELEIKHPNIITPR
jgi:hypothetical protein